MVMINFLKTMSFNYHMEERKFIKASLTVTHWRKSFLQLLLLQVYASFPFRQSNKTCIILGLYESSLDFQRRWKE